MTVNYLARVGNIYNFGVFVADTPIDAEFDRPVKRLVSGVDLGIAWTHEVEGSPVTEMIMYYTAGTPIEFTNRGGYPLAVSFMGTADSPCALQVLEYGDDASADYFEAEEPEEPEEP